MTTSATTAITAISEIPMSNMNDQLRAVNGP
jgi:hypothetical protein